MTVNDVVTIIKAETNYVANSLVLKSYDETGCTYKFLGMVNATYAKRRQFFIATSTTEQNITTRTVTAYVEVVPAE